MPIVAMIIGKPDFSGLTFTINDAVFRYGAFITDAITFLATAAATSRSTRSGSRGSSRIRKCCSAGRGRS